MSGRLRIVAADDELEMREYFDSTLTFLGHEVLKVVKCGRELIQACQNRHPDLVITDVRMPEVDGLAAIKEISKTMSIPIILISAQHDHAALTEVISDPVLAHLVKPFKQADLEAAIAIAVQRFQDLPPQRPQTD